MAFIALEVSVSGDSVDQLNTLIKDNPREGVQQLINLLKGLEAGAKDGTVAVVVRSSTASLAASGGGSSASYDLA